MSSLTKLIAGKGIRLTPSSGMGIVRIEALAPSADEVVTKISAGSSNVTVTPTSGTGNVSISVTTPPIPSADAYYLVTRSTNAPTNAVNLGALMTGVLQIDVTAGAATVSVPTLANQGVLFANGNNQLSSSASFVYNSFTNQLAVPNLRITNFGASGFLRHNNFNHDVVLDTSTYLTAAIQSAGNAGGSHWSAPTLDFSADFVVSSPSPSSILVTLASGAGGITALTGDVTASGTGSVAATIAANAVTFAKMQTIADQRIIGNVSGGTAVPSELTQAQARTFLGLATIATTGSASDLSTGTLPAGRFPALTGDVTTTAGSLATSIAANAVTSPKIAANAVTLSKIQTIGTPTILGNNTGGAASPIALTPSQVITMLGLAAVATSGSASDLTTGTLPAAQFGPLTGDVTTSGYAATIANNAVTTAKINTSAVTLAKIANIADQRILGNVSGSSAAPAELTQAQALTFLGLGSTITGSLTSGQVPYATSANTVASSSNFTWDNGTNTLSAPTLKTNVINAPTADLTLSTTAGGSQIAINPVTLLVVGGTGVQLSALTSNGFVKTSGGTGTLTVDTTSYLSTTTAASTYLTIATAATTYQPILSSTATRVLYSGGGSTISSDGSFAWSNASGLLTITNANNFGSTFAGIHIRDVGAAANAWLRVDSGIRTSMFAPSTGGLPYTFTDDTSSTPAPGNTILEIADGDIRSCDAAGNTNIQVTGGAIELGTGGIVNNGTVATTMTSLGPTGASTTIRKWLPITVAGTTYYAPLY
jgi:hypothetical protein